MLAALGFLDELYVGLVREEGTKDRRLDHHATVAEISDGTLQVLSTRLSSDDVSLFAVALKALCEPLCVSVRGRVPFFMRSYEDAAHDLGRAGCEAARSEDEPDDASKGVLSSRYVNPAVPGMQVAMSVRDDVSDGAYGLKQLSISIDLAARFAPLGRIIAYHPFFLACGRNDYAFKRGHDDSIDVRGRTGSGPGRDGWDCGFRIAVAAEAGRYRARAGSEPVASADAPAFPVRLSASMDSRML